MLVYKLRYIREWHTALNEHSPEIVEWHISNRSWVLKEDALEAASSVANSRKVELLRWNTATKAPHADRETEQE